MELTSQQLPEGTSERMLNFKTPAYTDVYMPKVFKSELKQAVCDQSN